MLAVKGIYQNGQLVLQEPIPFTQPVEVIVTFLSESVDADNQLLGLFANDIELIDEVAESAMQAREQGLLRVS